MRRKSLLLLFVLTVVLCVYSSAYCKGPRLSDCDISRETCDFFERYYGEYRFKLEKSIAPMLIDLEDGLYLVDYLYDSNLTLFVTFDDDDSVESVGIGLTDEGIKREGAYPDVFSAIEIGLRYLGITGTQISSEALADDSFLIKYREGIWVYAYYSNDVYFVMAF